MRWPLLILLLALGSSAMAQLTSPESVYDAEPGAFVSVPVTGGGDATLTVEAPDFLKLVGAPELRSGRGLVNLLLDRYAPAGEHRVVISAGTASITVTVRVAARYGVTLQVPEGETIVSGESVEYTLLVSNSGNAPEAVILEVSSRLAPQLSAERLELAAGEMREVVLRLRSAAGGVGRDTASITATVLEDESARWFAAIRTTLLPFAGYDQIEGPALRYRLDAGLSYGSPGFGYQLGARLGGQLSDYVTGSADLTFGARPNGEPHLAGRAAVAGERWRVGYYGAAATHRIDMSYDDVRGYAALRGEEFGFGVSYNPSPLSFSFDHRGGIGNRQTLTAGYRFTVLPELSLTPSVGLERRAVAGEEATILALVGLTAQLQAESLVGAARVRLPLPLDDGWLVATTLSTRTQSPFGVRAEASVGARGVYASVAVSEDVGEEVTLQQRLSYGAGNGNLNFAVRYRPQVVPMSVGANVGASLGDRGFGFNYGVNTGYSPAPFSVSAYLSGTGLGEWAYGGSLGYRQGGWRASLSYAHSRERDRLRAALAAREGSFSGSAAYSYDFKRLEHRGNLGLEYAFPQGHRLYSALAVSDSVSWQLGASFALTGGFATPEGIVNTFGGRAVGVVTGVAFHDQNRNGVRDPGEPVLADVTVASGGVSSRTDAEGRFRLVLPPGEHSLSVVGLSASYGQLKPLAITVEVGQEYQLDVPLETVVTLIVKAFDDRDRSGVSDASEPRLPGAGVVVQGAGGVSLRRFVDSRGEAVFQNLPPGEYTVALDPESLPRFYEPTSEPLTVTLEPGPITRLELGAAERPKEVVQTLRGGDLTLVARLEPTPAPPGADVLVTAQVTGEPDAVQASLPDGESVTLTLEDGVYRGRLSVPAEARGVLMVTVQARRGEAQRVQQVPLILAAGPLARLSTVPTIPDPGEAVQVEATLLVKAAAAEVELDGVRYALEPTADPYRFVGTVPAPAELGSYALELFVAGEKLAETRFRVQ